MPFDPIRSLAKARHEFGEHGGVNMSIEASTTFTVMQAGTMPDIFGGHVGPETEGGGCYLYGRHFNPTVYALGRSLAALEGTEAAYCTASGMAAISGAVIQLCQPGDEIVTARTIYGGTHALFENFLPDRMGVKVRFVDAADPAQVATAMTDKTRLVYCETVSNPTLDVANIPELARIAHARDARLVVDNTFSPLIVSPAQHGADIVVHSLTKFIGGCSDIIAGAICGSREFITSLMDTHHGALMLLGPTMTPASAFDLSLRIPHLGLRIPEHSRRALLFAERLADRGVPVWYPGLPDHPGHGLLKGMMNEGFGFGGIFGIDAGTRDKAFALLDTLQNKHRFGYDAVSLGYFETLMSCSGASTSSELSEDEQRAAGILPGYVRVSIGYTGDAEDRWAQFESALVEVGVLSKTTA
ncbi:MAG: aminotransferase class I/II-fold pyridoxal phosphate-dependent enzyme [Phycisphaeraceae bacterium]|nr:MAG: aminotransferase class I/II-fold pyridoxal phosphate-dependent enzyme [Phycisphaeraceae bacterium]